MKKRKKLFGCAALILTTALCAVLFESRLRPLVSELSINQARFAAVQLINAAVSEVFSQALVKEELLTIRQDAQGRVTSVAPDTMLLNRLAAQTTLRVQEAMKHLEDQDITVSLGSVIGGSLLTGRGPRLTVHVLPVGWVDTEYETDFSCAGINQTRLSIRLRIETEIMVAVPTGGRSTQVIVSAPVAEAVIVGEVPGSYVDVADEEDMLNLIPEE